MSLGNSISVLCSFSKAFQVFLLQYLFIKVLQLSWNRWNIFIWTALLSPQLLYHSTAVTLVSVDNLIHVFCRICTKQAKACGLFLYWCVSSTKARALKWVAGLFLLGLYMTRALMYFNELESPDNNTTHFHTYKVQNVLLVISWFPTMCRSNQSPLFMTVIEMGKSLRLSI